MCIVRAVVFAVSLMACGTIFRDFLMSIPIPILKVTQVSRAETALIKANAPKDKIADLSRAITSASKATNLSPELIVALIKTESEFDYGAVSSKGYVGLMQTPWATMKWAEVDIMYGAKILQEKLRFSKNDLKLALALYKGGNNKVAHRYAKETLKIYKSLLEEG